MMAMGAASWAPIPAPARAAAAFYPGRDLAAARRRRGAAARRPFVFTPRAVSDSRSSQTCLDPDASTVRRDLAAGAQKNSTLPALAFFFAFTREKSSDPFGLGKSKGRSWDSMCCGYFTRHIWMSEMCLICFLWGFLRVRSVCFFRVFWCRFLGDSISCCVQYSL